MMTKKMYNEMVAEIRAEVESMKVAEMRKVATTYGIKKPSQYRRPELTEKLVAQMAIAKKQAFEAEEAAKAAEKKAAKKASKAQNKGDKRYKATKVENENVEALADELLGKTEEQFKQVNLFDINRKVLIELMKKLHCKMWYRTYDKPTMVAKINAVMFAA